MNIIEYFCNSYLIHNAMRNKFNYLLVLGLILISYSCTESKLDLSKANLPRLPKNDSLVKTKKTSDKLTKTIIRKSSGNLN